VALASAISAIGNSFRYIAVMALITREADASTSISRIAILTAAALVPNVLIGRWTGLVVRKIGSKRALLIAEASC
jgi:hypothetical protein